MDYDSLVKGCDVSHYQGAISWPKLADDGVKFAYIKALENMGEDPMFSTNATGAENNGIVALAYPFVRPGDTETTIEKFDSIVGLTMPAVLDCEVSGISGSVSTWIAGLAKRPTLAYIGLSPPFTPPTLIWTLPRILPEYRFAPRIPAWDGVAVPDWQNNWVIWQRSDQGTFQGETGNFDLDVLAVPLERFKAWCLTGSWSAAARVES